MSAGCSHQGQPGASRYQNPASVQAVIDMGYYEQEETFQAYRELVSARCTGDVSRYDVTTGASSDTAERAGLTSTSLLMALDERRRSNKAKSSRWEQEHRHSGDDLNEDGDDADEALQPLSAAAAADDTPRPITQQPRAREPNLAHFGDAATAVLQPSGTEASGEASRPIAEQTSTREQSLTNFGDHANLAPVSATDEGASRPVKEPTGTTEPDLTNGGVASQELQPLLAAASGDASNPITEQTNNRGEHLIESSDSTGSQYVTNTSAICNNPDSDGKSAASNSSLPTQPSGADYKGKKRSRKAREPAPKASEGKENDSSATSTETPPEVATSAHAPSAPDQGHEKNLDLKRRVRVLREENRKLKARQTCRQCRERPVSLTLLPCGHFCFCEECGSKFTACPICRKTILADVRTIVS